MKEMMSEKDWAMLQELACRLFENIGDDNEIEMAVIDNVELLKRIARDSFQNDVIEADGWFCEIDFDMMERISGKRRDDYSDEDGYQEFVDAVEEWWNSRLDQEKVEIYKENE